jgi:predicted permease
MAGSGLYLHRQNYVTSEGKKMLALISQQITIPAYLFAKIIYCPSDGGHNTINDTDNNEFVCPSVADRIGDLWMLLLWPFYVVLCGLISGYIVAKLSNTPPNQHRACMVALAFPNSTGLAITLLSVIHKQFSSSAELGKIDPIAFLSVYLLLYPVLQWGLGGWLLAPTEESKHTNDNNNDESENSGNVEANPLLRSSTLDSTNTGKIIERTSSLRIPHVLNYETSDQKTFGRATKSSSATLDSMVKELSFGTLHDDNSNEEDTESNFHIPGVLIPQPGLRRQTNNLLQVPGSEEFRPSATKNNAAFSGNGVKVRKINVIPSEEQIRRLQRNDVLPLTETLLRISRKVLQPPVTWSLIGLFIASFPSLRGVLVNIWGHRGRQAPLQFVYDGIYTVCWQLVAYYLYCADDFTVTILHRCLLPYLSFAGWSICSTNKYDDIGNKSFVDLSKKSQYERLR